MQVQDDKRYIWLGGALLPVEDAKINVLSPTAQFGLNVFEGIRCYWNEERQQLFAFRLEDHLKRLLASQRLLQLEDAYTLDEVRAAFFEVIIANKYKEDIAVRQTLFVEGLGTWSSAGPVNMFIAPIPKRKTSAEYNKDGLHCCVSSWERINDNAISPRIKCGANYMNSRMAQLEALRNGYDTAIFLNHARKVAEGPGSCLFIVRNNKLITPPVTDSILESITRDTLIKIAREIEIEVEERSVDRTELYMCDESFLCGSAMEITPIFSVDRYCVGEGTVGPLTKQIRVRYEDTVRAKRPTEWLTPIYKE